MLDEIGSVATIELAWLSRDRLPRFFTHPSTSWVVFQVDMLSASLEE